MKQAAQLKQPGPRRSKKRLWLGVSWFCLIIIYVFSLLFPGYAMFSSSLILAILLRSLLIALSWYLFISPFILFLLKRWLAEVKLKNSREINSVNSLMPYTRLVFLRSWANTSDLRGFARIKEWGKRVLVNVLGYSDGE